MKGPTTGDSQGPSRESPSPLTAGRSQDCGGRGGPALPGGGGLQGEAELVGPRIQPSFPLSQSLPRGLGDRTVFPKGHSGEPACSHLC